MKRVIVAATIASALSAAQISHAQTAAPAPIGNNPTTSGLYLEGMLGLNVLDDIDFDVEGIAADVTIKSKVGAFGAVAVGYNLPQGPINLRLEGEFSIRGNKLDEFVDVVGDAFEGVDGAKTNAYAGLVNAHLDYYIIPNFALTAGAGVGYASVKADTVVDAGVVNVILFDDESDSAIAYQGRAGARYSLSSNATISLGYTYFATGELTIEDAAAGTDATFNYESHAFHGGFAYHF